MKTKRLLLILLPLAFIFLAAGFYWSVGLSGRKTTYHKSPPLPAQLAAELAAKKQSSGHFLSQESPSSSDEEGSLSNAQSNSSLHGTGNKNGSQGAMPVASGATGSLSNRRRSTGQKAKGGPNPMSYAGNTSGNESEVRLPLALIEPDPSLKFNEGQKERLKNLRQSFIEEVGGLNQDPSDPGYLERWQTAQWKSDQLFKTLYGWKAYDMQLLKAAQEAGNYQPE